MVAWSVRPGADSDSEALIELIGTIWAEYPGVVLDVDAEEPWLRAPAAFYAERGGEFWVAADDDSGRVIACVGIKPSGEDTVELKSLYVAAEGRRTGLGSALVRLVEETAIDRSARRIVLWSDTRFTDAHRLYTRLGYIRTGESRELDDLSNTVEFGFAKDVLSSLFDFGDPAASGDRFAELAARGDRFGLIAATQRARTLGLRGLFDEARALLEAIDDSDPVVQGWIAIERGRVANSSGEVGRGRDWFEQALTLGREHGDDGLAVDAAHMIGIVGTPDEQVSFAEFGLSMEAGSRDPRARSLAGALLNNLGVALGEQDRWDEALAVHEQAVAWRAERGNPGPLAIARWQLGRALRGVGRVQDALAVQMSLDAVTDPYVAEERGECLLLLGREAEARPWFAAAAEGLAADGWTADHEPARLERLQKLAAG